MCVRLKEKKNKTWVRACTQAAPTDVYYSPDR